MAFASGGAGRGARPSSHSGSSATTSKASTGRVRSTPSSSSRPVPASAAARVRPSQMRSGARSGSSGAGSHAYAAERAASRSRSPEAAAIVEAVPVQELSDRIAAQLTSKKLIQESDLEDLKFHVMSILQPALKKTSYEEVQRLTVELTEARTRTAAARSEISRLRSEAQLLEQKSAEADEKSRRAETRATKAENRLKSSLQDPMTFKLGSETVEVRPTTAKAKDTVGPLPEGRGSVTGGAPGAHSPRRSITSGQLSIGGGGSPEPSEVGEGGEDAGHRAQRLLEKQRKKEEADAARRAAEERMKDQKKKKQEEKGNKEHLQAMKEMGEELKKAKAAAKDAETQASQMRIKLEQAEAGAKSAEKARSNAEKKLSSAEQELRSLRNDPVFDQVNMLRDGVRNLEKEVDELQQQVAEKEELLSAAYEAKALTEKERGEEISALKEDISRLQSGSDRGQELKRLQQELDAARAETVRLQATAEPSKAVEGGSGSGDAEELRKLREELASTRAELASLKASPTQAPGAEKATPEAAPSPEAEKVQEELRKLREELAASQAEVSRLRSLPPEGGDKAQEWHDLQEELAAAKAEAARLKAEGAPSIAASTEDMQKLQQELAASQAEVARLRSLPPEGGEQSQEWHKLQEELAAAKAEAARLKAEGAASSAASTEDVQKLKQELEAAKAEAARSKAEPGAAGGQAEELGAAKAEAARSKAEPGSAGGPTEEVQKLQEELAAAKAQVELLSSSTPGGEEVLKLQEELRKLREEQATRQSEQSSSRQEAAETPEDVLKLQEELKAARAEIAQLKSQAPSQPEKLEELRGEMAAPPAATETVASVEVGPAPATEEAAASAATAPVAAAPATAGAASSSEAAEEAKASPASGGASVLGPGEGAATASTEELRKLKEELAKTKKELLEAQAGAEAASKKAEELGGLQQELEALRAEKDASVKEQDELKRQLNESNLATKRAEREKREAIAEAERLDALEDEQQRADLEAEKEQARKEQEEKAQKQAEEHEAERKKLQEEERKKRVEAKQHFEAEKARIREEETEKNQKKARDIADQMEQEYTNSLLSGVWEAWEHAFRQGSAERKKAEAKAEIERLRKEELLKGEVSKAQIADQMYAQYCRELLDGVFELWRDAFKEEKGKKAADAARLKMEQEMHRFKQAEHDKAFNTAKQIAEQMYKKYCNGLFDEIVAVWKEETMKTKKEKEERTKKAQEEGRIKAQQEKDLREAEVLAERMRKTLQNDDVKFCFDFWVSDYRAEGQRRRDEEAKKKHEAELAALKRMEQETGERAALQIAQKMYKKIVDDNMKWCVDNWHRIIKKEKAQKKEEQAKRQHQDELDRIRREELEKKDKAAQKLAEQMFKKYWDDNIGVVVELWRRLAVLTKETKARRQHEEELARLKRSHKEVGTKAALEIAGRMSKAHCDSLLKMSISSWRVWTHQTQSSRKEEEAKKKYEQDMARIRRLEVEKADKAAEVAGLNMFRKVMNDNLGLIVSEWKDFTKNELLHRKLEKDMRDTKNHIDSLKKEARAKGERVRHLVAQNLLAKDKKEVLSDAFAKWVINWRQHLLEQQQHAERIQHRDQVEKMKRSEAERMQKMKGLMASQFNSTGNRSLLHLCVNNWRLVWEAAIAERQQNQAVEQLTGKLRQMDKQKNEMINRTKDKIFLAFAGRQRAELLSVVFTAWKADAKEEHLLRRKEELASSYEKDLRVMHKKQKDIEALAREKMVKGTLSQITGATLSVCLLQWRSYTKDSKRERSEAEMRDQLQEEIRRQKREAEKLNDAKSRQIALNMVSFERNSTLSVCVVAWRQATQASKREADEALGRQKAQQEYTQLKLEKDKAMNVTRDRMAVRLLGHQQSHLLSAVFTLWRGASKEEKMSRQQADKDRANKIELARLDGLRREAAKMKAHSIAARFFQKHHESLLAEMFIQFRKSVEIQIEERKVEEAKRQHEEDRRKMEQRHNDRRAKFIAQSVQGKERMMLLSIVKRCLVAWSQQVVESQMELMRSEAQEKHSTEMNEVKSQLRDHSKKNGVYAALSHELANHQFLLQRMLGVWREFRAEQAVHRAYQAKIAELNVQFEDDLAELMHAQGMKMYNLRLALADLKASSERKLLFQYCMQKWDECKYQRSLENELAQINERHEDELAELVHAQGLAKHRMIQTSQDRFLKGVMRQELQRHFLAWSHVKRLNISTAAELLTVAKAKQQLGKEMEVKDLKALRLKDHVVHHVSRTITFVRLKDIWLAWLHQVLLHRLEKTQDRKDRSHRKEIQRIRREAADEHTALGERMHSELEQVGRESHLRDMLVQWQAVVKNMRSHRNYHGEMDQIRQEAAQEVKQKEKKTVEQLSSFAIHSAELLIRRRMKEPLVMVFVNWRMVQEREKYQQHAARMQQEAQDQRDHHQNVLQSKETKKEVACWQLATFSYLVRERVIIRLAIFHYWREASMWSKKAHLHHLRRQGQEIASHSKEVSLLVTQMLAHQRDLSLLTKVMVQWKQVVEREANQRSLEQKDEENVERVKTSVHNERVAGSKRAQVLVKWLLHLELQNQAKWLAAWSGEVKYAKIVRKMEGDKEAHDLAMVEVENKMEKHQDALVPYWLRLKRQMVLMRYFPAFIFIPYMNHSEAHLQKTIEKLDKKRERQIADLYKLRRKSVADAGVVLHFFRGQRENQLILSLVLVIWSEVISDQMAMRRWNEQREVKLELERSLQELKDKTWHLRIDTKKGKDLTDTCRHMGEWTGQLLMELSTTRAWGSWRIWHLQEVHSRVQAKANNHTEARVMAERMKVQQRQKKDEVVMSNIMVAAGEVSSVKLSFRAWEILTRKEKEHRHKTNMRQDHKKELYELRQETVAKLRASNSRENGMKDMQQVLRCFVCWCTDVKAGKMATDLLVAEEKKRQEVEAQMQQVQQDLTVEMSARKTAESEARTATELLHNNGIQFPTEPEAAAARPERFMLPVERVAQALQKVYRRRLTTALVAMLTSSPRKMAWYQREPGDRQALADNSKSKRKAQSTAKPAASKAAAPAMLALPAPAATPGAPGGVASTLDFLARTRQLVASSFDADAMAPGGRDIDDGFGRQGNGYPVPSLPRFGAQDAQVSPPESPGAFERPRLVAKPRPDSAGPNLVITGVKSPPPPPPSTAAGPTLPTRQAIEQQITLQDTLTHMQDTMRRMDDVEPKVSQ